MMKKPDFLHIDTNLGKLYGCVHSGLRTQKLAQEGFDGIN